MKNLNFPHLSLKEYFNVIVSLISDDLRIEKHLYHLSLGLNGFDPTQIKFELHERIFTLVGITKEMEEEKIRDWYFAQIERVREIDISDDKAILKLSGEILDGLIKVRHDQLNSLNTPIIER